MNLKQIAQELKSQNPQLHLTLFLVSYGTSVNNLKHSLSKSDLSELGIEVVRLSIGRPGICKAVRGRTGLMCLTDLDSLPTDVIGYLRRSLTVVAAHLKVSPDYLIQKNA